MSSMCFPEQAAVLPLDSINQLIFVTEIQSIFCEVGTEYSDFI
jgi:hypothetical protein